jgi:hypothetical protein
MEPASAELARGAAVEGDKPLSIRHRVLAADLGLDPLGVLPSELVPPAHGVVPGAHQPRHGQAAAGRSLHRLGYGPASHGWPKIRGEITVHLTCGIQVIAARAARAAPAIVYGGVEGGDADVSHESGHRLKACRSPERIDRRSHLGLHPICMLEGVGMPAATHCRSDRDECVAHDGVRNGNLGAFFAPGPEG